MSNHDNYYYNIMPFGLKNVDATYQRLIDVVFAHEIWRNMEVYVEDMIVKTIERRNHVEDLKDVWYSVRPTDYQCPESCRIPPVPNLKILTP